MSTAPARIVKRAVCVWFATQLSGCASMFLGSSQEPLRTVEFRVRPQSRTLLLMIHGTGDRPESFESHQFVQELRTRGADVEVVAIATKLIYFLDDAIDDRIHQDVVHPARMAGFDRVIVLGVSTGGLAAISYAHHYPDQVDGLILFAPFLGPTLFAKEIEGQGGLLKWWPNAPFEAIEFDWLWLAEYGRGRADPPIDLMYGSEDRFARALDLLARVLPADAVHVIDGRHEWRSWLSLWRDHLDRDPFGLIPRVATSKPRGGSVSIAGR